MSTKLSPMGVVGVLDRFKVLCPSALVVLVQQTWGCERDLVGALASAGVVPWELRHRPHLSIFSPEKRAQHLRAVAACPSPTDVRFEAALSVDAGLGMAEQRQMAREVVSCARGLMKHGKGLVVSVSGDVFMRELNLLVMLGGKSGKVEETRAKCGIDESATLPPSLLMVFDVAADGTAIQMPVERSGFKVASMDALIEEMQGMSGYVWFNLLG